MKKSILLGFVAALFMGQSAMAQSAQEITYVEDPSQGYILNNFSDNWFISAEGGINYYFDRNNSERSFLDRFSPNAGIWVGKWFSPIIGLRAGANFTQIKGMGTDGGYGWYGTFQDGNTVYDKYKRNEFGAQLNAMLNLTNWWCGYRPGRVYNAVLHGGGGAMFTFRRAYDGADLRWRSAKSTPLFINVGLQNNFAVSKSVDIFLDVAYQLFKEGGAYNPHYAHDLQLSAGLNVHFGKKDWNCPVTAVCPTWKYTDAEGDALVARLAQADAKIASLQKQLDECLKRPVEKVSCEGLATVYYPINQYSLSSREKTILKSMAEVMKETPNQKYILTGWADNYTGNDEVNTRLRNQRVNGVKAFLVKCGVDENQLDARIDANNLTDFGAKGAPLDRAVTIKLAD